MKGNRIRRVILAVVGVLLVGWVLLAYDRYRQDIDAARIRVSSGSQVVNTACGPIEYIIVGEGPPVLIVHGAGGGFDQGLEFGRSLSDQGFRVVTVSRFGYLRTPLPADASPMAQADAHACLLDALNLRRVAVLGASAGAPSTMQLCLRHPERCKAMVLLVPLAFTPQSAGESPVQPSMITRFIIHTTLRSDFVFWAATKLARGTMVKSILATPLTDFENANPEEQARVLQVLRNIQPISQREKGLGNDSAIAASLPRYELERMTVPTLVISAENDLFGTFMSARYTAEHIPGARFIGYPTGGHLGVGHQKEMWSEVIEFLNKFQIDR